ncbi:MAG: hypothetical protein R3B70_08575 [Polyangiaceae bacterium]
MKRRSFVQAIGVVPAAVSLLITGQQQHSGASVAKLMLDQLLSAKQ